MLISESQKASAYALWLLSGRDYAVEELRKKLLKKHKEKGWTCDIEKIIADLLRSHYLDDERFARRFIEARLEFRPRGKYLIGRELSMKGIDKDLFEKMWKALRVDEETVARKAFLLKERTIMKVEDPRKRKEKIIMLLKGRGFQPDVIYKIAEEA
ncbi:MAG: Regulatory protein RecX [Candidatus Peregrinibacteria bacterium GW2011_GWA2_47_7]|nr:MAG: Regulatory protein RecX [Candidatus Peregrinibacteria bacterium GW2011_GWA2_47_7]